jgi:hypothetical protein
MLEKVGRVTPCAPLCERRAKDCPPDRFASGCALCEFVVKLESRNGIRNRQDENLAGANIVSVAGSGVASRDANKECFASR